MKIVPMSVELLDSMGSDKSVVGAARVSFNKQADNYTEDQNIRLINYLVKHNHWSPLAHTSLQFRIKAPIFVARQLVKHQVGGVWNEVSRRYVDDEPEFFFPQVWRKKAENVKQGSSDEAVTELWGANGKDGYLFYGVEDIVELMLEAYNDALKHGIAPEQARMCLPLNSMTEWWWTGSLMFFARVCKLRLDPHAQAETREVAQLINDAVPEQFKHSWKALMA